MLTESESLFLECLIPLLVTTFICLIPIFKKIKKRDWKNIGCLFTFQLAVAFCIGGTVVHFLMGTIEEHSYKVKSIEYQDGEFCVQNQYYYSEEDFYSLSHKRNLDKQKTYYYNNTHADIVCIEFIYYIEGFEPLYTKTELNFLSNTAFQKLPNYKIIRPRELVCLNQSVYSHFKRAPYKIKNVSASDSSNQCKLWFMDIKDSVYSRYGFTLE